VNTN